MRTVVLALIGTISICLAGPLSVSAQTVTRDSGVDLVILIDQSGSMWGNPRTHPGKNDPWAHRIGAAKSIILRLIQHAETTRATHRVAVIDFADEAEVALPIQEIRIDLATPTALDRVRALVEASVQARDWGNTNTAAALETALSLFAQMDTTTPSPNRRRIVLLVTDGRPTTPIVSEAVLRQSIRDHVTALSGRQVELWVVGLNDADDYWNAGDGAFWEELASKGRARFAESAAATLPSVFQGVVDEWLGLRSVLVSGTEYDCPPYLRRIVFHATFGRPRGEIKIVDPDGGEVKRTGGGPSAAPGTFAQFAVDDPKPGTYRLIRDSSRSAIVHVEEYSPSLERLRPRGAADRGVRTPLSLLARMASGNALAPIPSAPIKASFLITDPSGGEAELAATVAANGRFEGTWEPSVAGRHSITLRGLVRRADGTDYDIFANVGDTYSRFLDVGTRKPYWLQLVLPELPDGIRVFPWQRAGVVRFQLIGPDGNAVVNLDGIVQDAPTWVSVQAERESAGLGPPSALALEAPAWFAGEVPLSVRWLAGEAWWKTTEVTLRVVAQPGRMRGEDYLHSVILPTGSEDYRVGDDLFTVGPIAVRASWWFWSIVASFGLCVAGSIGWYAVTRLTPLWIVRREDRRYGRQIYLRVYDDARDPAGEAGSKFTVTGGHRFRFDGQLTITSEDRTFVAKKFRVVRYPRGGGRPSATLSYRWAGDKKDRRLALLAGSYARFEGLPDSSFVARLVEG